MVTTSLYTGLSGLRLHQQYLDVIGNNLANVSTPGFWGSRATFSDILSHTLRPGSAPEGNFGGQNPMQIGLGATIATIDLDQTQGTFQDTGRALDVAIQGRGFFTLTNGNQSFFTRVGTFGIDRDRQLVDVRSGHHVVSATGGRITIPVTDTQPPKLTSEVKFQGNLPATVTGPLQEILESSSPFHQGTAASKTATPPTGTTYNLTGFTGKTLLVSVNGAAQQTVDFPASAFVNPAAATAAEIMARFTAANVQNVTLTAGAGGTIAFATNKLGDGATLKLDDGSGAAGLLNVLGLNATLATGTQSAATTATSLNSLTVRNKPYIAGDQITIKGNNADGSVFSDTLVFGANNGDTTLGDLVTFLNARLDTTQGSVSVAANGALQFKAQNKGDAKMSLFIGDATGNTGSSSFPDFKLTQDGKGPDTATSSIDVVDSLGRTHPVSMTFTRSMTDDTVWDLAATTPAADGTVAAGSISTIRFNSDGSFNVVGGGTNSLAFTWNGIPNSQTIFVNLGTSGKFDGVALLGNKATVAATDQDGYIAGTLLTTAFDQSGRLLGYYSNGKTQEIDQLRICVFPNEAGLMRAGDTLFIESPNSDDPIATVAGAAGAGIMRPGALENSNVDIAKEFVQMIEAQRGFQANSRVITTADEILIETLSIKR